MTGSTGLVTAGVIGTGSLGSNHARIYSDLIGIGEVFVFDTFPGRAAKVAEKYGAKECRSIEEVLEKCDLVSICTPATDHSGTAESALSGGVHVLVEKPLASDSTQGKKMVDLAAEKGLVLQVGHIERFNGTFEAASALVNKPLFIESHRLGTFTPRGIDVSVVVDLMIHDIDIVLTLLGGEKLVDLRASGAGVLTHSPDIVNARLEFESGCTANLTASRISREPLRKMRIFQENLYISADFREKSIEAFTRDQDVPMERLAVDPTAFIKKIDVSVDREEPLRKEIASFVRSVMNGTAPVVTGGQALEALRVAERILASVNGG